MTEACGKHQCPRLPNTAVAQVQDAVLITEATPTDLPDPLFVFVNEAFTRMTGDGRDEALGATPRMLAGPATERPRLDTIRAALAKRAPLRRELTNYRKDGIPCPVELDIGPVFDPAGACTHFVAIQSGTRPTNARACARSGSALPAWPART